ncbi:MAG: hypothetical protein PHH21_00665 [Candidatus Pacebacteria bacterium]|nr:hypothetical protein [Candidatus Paceibacterota bacterium]
MAIEIEQTKKKNTPRENNFLILSILLLLAAFLAYFYLSMFVLSGKEAEASKLNSQLAALGKEDVQSKEAALTQAGIYIGDFKLLLENNPKTSRFFDTFQKWVHPRVVYSNMKFDVSSRKVTMAGQTSGFQNVMQQIALLRREQTIESYQISNVQLADSGQVSFDLEVTLRAEVLK